MYKKGQAAGRHLVKLLCTLHILPISSAACERGFSQLNLHQTSLRNRLAVSRINDLWGRKCCIFDYYVFTARRYASAVSVRHVSVLYWARRERKITIQSVAGFVSDS